MSIPIILSAISILFSLITILKINKKYKLKEGKQHVRWKNSSRRIDY